MRSEPSALNPPTNPPTPSSPPTPPRPQSIAVQNDKINRDNCYIDLDRLKSYGYESSVLYSRWDINVERSKKFDKFSDRLKVPIPKFDPVQIGDAGRKPLEHCAPATTVVAPLQDSVDASHITFGVATSIDRLQDSMEAFSHWASGTKARIFALVEPGPEVKEIRQQAIELEIDLTIIESDQEVLDRYISLTRVLLENRKSNSKWGVIMDDDTFYPSMYHLVKRLATYDASVPQYVGALTEDVMGLSNYGYMAYGGAGIFLSMPLLEEMDRHHDECAKLTEFGDKRISQCIYLHTTTKLTWDRSLHQLDFWQSDGSGFFESGRELPLSLHHWKSTDWFPVDLVGMSKVSSVCGDECQLKRWRIGDSDNWFLVNGFSVIQHSHPVKDTVSMEQTWDPSPWAREEGWAYSLGPLRPKDEGKVALRLRDAYVDRQGSLRQIYIYDPEDGQPPYVLEAVWKVTKGA